MSPEIYLPRWRTVRIRVLPKVAMAGGASVISGTADPGRFAVSTFFGDKAVK